MDLLAVGREAEVFALDDDRVLRRFRNPTRSAAPTAALLQHLTALGYPVPRVLGWDGPELVQERVHGPRMDDAIAAGSLGTAEAGLILADLHDRLHARAWEGSADPLLHLDLHPQNVLISQGGPVVVDWSNARPGPAGLDVAMSGLILTQVATADPAYEEAIASLVRTMTTAATADARPHVDEAVALRRGDPHMSAEELAHLSHAADMVRSLC